MGSFGDGFTRPTPKPDSLIKAFQGIYAGQELTLLSYVPAGKYIYGNEDVFIDDGGAGQVIPSIYNATAETELQATVSGILKSQGTDIKRYVGYSSPKATGWTALTEIDFYNQGDIPSFVGDWVDGYSNSSGSSTLEATYIKLLVTLVYSTRTRVTANKIDMTNIKALHMEYDAIGPDYGSSHARLGIGFAQLDDSYYASVESNVSATGLTLSLDTSNIKGDFYLKARDYTAADARDLELRIYRIWGDL